MTARATLPHRRRCETFELTHGGQNTPFQITVGYYTGPMYNANGHGEYTRIGEVFIAGSKSGSAFDAVARDGAILLSLALQHGVALETIKHALTREGDNSPSTIVGAVVDRLMEKF
jgi:hypothetical protein